jgi:hypothetical protein
MRSKTFLTLCPLIAGSALLVSGCLGKERPPLTYPSAADLSVETKPRLDPAAVESEAALDRFEIDMELWGERGWASVARLCRFFDTMGMRGLDCPPPPRPG